MTPFSRYEKRIDDHTFSFDFYWNSENKLTRIVCFDKGVVPLSYQQPPYGVAAIMRDVKNFFITGEPLHELHWSLIDETILTDFSKKVFEATLQIPHGETRTYAWVAKKIGKPLASRAVGQALRRNPFPLLIPCHRVVSDKNLGGFMGTNNPDDLELKFKNWLLHVESGYRNPFFSFVETKPKLFSVGFSGLVS